MYRSTGSACPACGGHLTVLRSTLQASGCDACGGLMLGPQAAVHVMKGLGDALEVDVAKTGAAHERTSKSPPPPDSGARECPSCGNLMMRVVIGEIIVDSCAAHGTWFDRQELAAVVEVCRRLKKQQADEASGTSISADDIANGGIAVVTGVFSLTWSLVTGFFEALADPDRSR